MIRAEHFTIDGGVTVTRYENGEARGWSIDAPRGITNRDGIPYYIVYLTDEQFAALRAVPERDGEHLRRSDT